MKFYKKIFITAILLVNIFICSVFAGKEQDDFEFGLKLFQQDPSMAADQFEKFISTYPRSSSIADAYLWLGQCYQILEQYDSSILKFSVITVNYPKYHNLDIAVFNLGLGYYYKNEFENAIFQFNKYIKISSSTTAKKKKNSENLRAASIYIGDCYFNTGKYDKAIETYKNENDSKEDISLSFKLFKAYYLNKQYDKALDISDKFNFEQSDTGLLSDLDRQRFYFYTGDIYFAKKNHEKALSYLTAVEKFSIKPDFINLVLLRISQCYDMLNNQDKSIEYLLKIESTGMPHYLNEVPYRIGLIYYNSGRYDIASNYFVTGLKKYPDIIREDLLALSINALYKADKLNDLIYVYENFAVKNKISNLEILEKTVYAYYTLNKYDDVLKISSIIKLTDDQKYFNIKFFEASSYFHLKKHQKSITELKLLL
ncbi:tetratricopeptide repeat protein, partial [Candidatus Dependentiae bacterium]|nr:tetratricopeptide repeat protein [Candidatus Dependentiae bacterium]